MPDLKNLRLLIQTNVPLMVVETHEERRVIELFKRLTDEVALPLHKWTVVNGLQRLERGFLPQKFNANPSDVLHHIKKTELPGIYLLCDFHPYLEDPINLRLIREIAQARNRQRHLVFLSPSLEMPEGLRPLAARFKLAPPNQSALLDLITRVAREWAQQNPGKTVTANKKNVYLLARHLVGLNLTEAERLVRNAIFDDGAITEQDIKKVMKSKYAMFNQNAVLQLEYDTARFADVGGLEAMKRWLMLRKAVFHAPEQNVHGLDRPKGVMLLGVQGCGKSLAAKAVAGMWEAPLLRLDFGTLYDKYIGETEKNLRESLETAKSMAPCVLWIDEIEKGISSGGGDDGGVSRRVLGTLLTWMAEKKEPVFLVATANDVTSLPPELLRKGRFDEIFFVDLPDDKIRRIIFEIQLTKRNLAPPQFNLARLSQAAQGFSGAEIEQAIISSLYAAVGSGKQLDEGLILEELNRTKPLSVVMREKVEGLRQWAAGRTVPAN